MYNEVVDVVRVNSVVVLAKAMLDFGHRYDVRTTKNVSGLGTKQPIGIHSTVTRAPCTFLTKMRK